jgi:hypothetical protein
LIKGCFRTTGVLPEFIGEEVKFLLFNIARGTGQFGNLVGHRQY